MTNRTLYFYTIAFENYDSEIVDYNVADFFNYLEQGIKSNYFAASQKIKDRTMNIFQYKRADINGDRIFVIPFGTLKKNPTYKESNADSFQFLPVNDKLYDINMLYYNDIEKIALFSSFTEGPSIKNVAIFLNNYLKHEADIRLCIKPILKETELEKIKAAKEVSTVDFVFDLDNDIDKYFEERTHNKGLDFFSSLGLLSKYVSDDLSYHTMRMTFGNGHRKKTMNIKNVYELLSSMDVDDDFITEITVNYVNGITEKCDVAKLKQSEIKLKDTITISNLAVGLDNIMMDKAPTLIENNIDNILTRRRIYFNKDAITKPSQDLILQNPQYILTGSECL